MDINYMDQPTVSEAVKKKADRLLAEGRVRHIGGEHFEVDGDHGSYKLWVAHPEMAMGWCPCASRDMICSHIYASAVWALAHPQEYQEKAVPLEVGDPFAGLSD